jgi:hypothetical protein
MQHPCSMFSLMAELEVKWFIKLSDFILHTKRFYNVFCRTERGPPFPWVLKNCLYGLSIHPVLAFIDYRLQDSVAFSLTTSMSSIYFNLTSLSPPSLHLLFASFLPTQSSSLLLDTNHSSLPVHILTFRFESRLIRCRRPCFRQMRPFCWLSCLHWCVVFALLSSPFLFCWWMTDNLWTGLTHFQLSRSLAIHFFELLLETTRQPTAIHSSSPTEQTWWISLGSGVYLIPTSSCSAPALRSPTRLCFSHPRPRLIFEDDRLAVGLVS